jgi:rod shape determining protein RodA
MSSRPLGSSRSLLAGLHVDGPLLGAALLAAGFGLVVLYSASGQSADLVIKQGVRFAAGLIAMFALAQVSPERLLRWAPGLYAVGMFLLGVVAIIGIGRGSQRWIDLGFMQFQPSEIMKLAVPLMAAWYLRGRVLPPSFGSLGIGLAIIVVPVVLIAEQPDLGTAVLVAAAGLFVLFLAGTAWRVICAAGLTALLAAPAAWPFMHDYQRQRILTLLDPDSDPLGAGYHTIQGVIAVGSGGLFGKGWLNGTQSHLEFIPERATDFIFAVLSEEFGFVGVTALIAAYSLIISRGLIIAMNAQTIFGRLVAGSLTLTFFIYVFVNMGMVSGVLPVVGVPLPLISYGGTSAVTLMAGFGMLMAIHTHRRFIAGL